jgi:exopolysaccharide biosynthesis protein
MIYWLFSLVIFFLSFSCLEASQISSLRYFSSSEKMRFVFDLDQLPSYDSLSQDNHFLLKLENTGINFQKENLVFDEQFFKKIDFYEKENSTIFETDSNFPYKTAIFTLKNPLRLVLDVYKVFEEKYIETLNDKVEFVKNKKSQTQGLLSLNILRIVRDNQNSLKYISPENSGKLRERLSVICKNNPQILAAVNGGFFSTLGKPRGILINEGQVVAFPLYSRAVLGLTTKENILIDRLNVSCPKVLVGDKEIKINGINQLRQSNNETIIFTPEFGLQTKTPALGMSLVVIDGVVEEIWRGPVKIPKEGIVISIGAVLAKSLETKIEIKEKVSYFLILPGKWNETVLILGAGPLLVKNGNVVRDFEKEKFKTDVIVGRAPRTAFGANDKYIFMLVADGRQELSVGMEIGELAAFMKSLGCDDALNLDGGGSSTMVINGEIVNNPCEGQERPIANALAIVTNTD